LKTRSKSSRKSKKPNGVKLSGRNLQVRVKTAKGRKVSSVRWLNRQLNDPYVQEAKKHGFRSRAAFKLIQLNEKFKLLRSGQRVVDLGSAPGSWSQVIAEIVDPLGSGGKVIAIDLLEMEEIAPVQIIRGDIREPETQLLAKQLLGNSADVIFSDMLPSVSGHKATDQYRSIALCEDTYVFSVDLLVIGGTLVMKMLTGVGQDTLLKLLKQNFKSVKTFKPPASRSESSETYVVAKGFRKLG
tara:strand:- start:172 stop:897 length:726 start_codon:yes stop_codon:yes gene_type:complete